MRTEAKPSLFPYVFICHQVEKYERLVKSAKDDKELEFRLEQRLMWKKKLIELSN